MGCFRHATVSPICDHHSATVLLPVHRIMDVEHGATPEESRRVSTIIVRKAVCLLIPVRHRRPHQPSPRRSPPSRRCPRFQWRRWDGRVWTRRRALLSLQFLCCTCTILHIVLSLSESLKLNMSKSSMSYSRELGGYSLRSILGGVDAGRCVSVGGPWASSILSHHGRRLQCGGRGAHT